MTNNVGTVDRAFRFLIGIALIALALGLIPGVAPQVWGWIGVIAIGTAIFGTCPAYSLFGLSTCARK